MSRDKQTEIEEMAKAVCHLDRTCDECMTSFECKAMMYAKRFYEAGYRNVDDIFEDIFEGRLEVVNKRSGDKLKKASEVAREIFAEIEAIKCVGLLPSSWVKQFAELKKKYTQDKGRDKIAEFGNPFPSDDIVQVENEVAILVWHACSKFETDDTDLMKEYNKMMGRAENGKS